MEPSIYKPSIYKGAGIYKTGTGGGGGGGTSNFICGKKYKSVIMPDGKEWTVENLDLEITTSGAAYYGDDKNTYGWEGKRYGQLYSQSLILSLQGLFEGWRIPTDSDFNDLITAISTDVAYKLKSKTGWLNGNGIDAFGFNAVPAGNRTLRTFYSEGTANTFWTINTRISYYLDAGNNLNRDASADPDNCLYSIRLIRDV